MKTPDPAPDTTLFLVNLGTPDEPTARAVSRFLREFLLDPRVVAIPRLLWQPLLQWVILPRRSPVVAAKYAQVWLPGEDGGSPLTTYTRRLARGVQAAAAVGAVDHGRVDTARLRRRRHAVEREGAAVGIELQQLVGHGGRKAGHAGDAKDGRGQDARERVRQDILADRLPLRQPD